MAQIPGLLKADEVATALNTSAETVRRWARDGKLPAVFLPSGAIRFRESDITALVLAGDTERASA